MANELAEIVQSAITEHTPAPVEESKVETPVTTTTKTVEEPKVSKDEVDLDTANALQIWKALKEGGEGAAFIIDSLATRNGYSRIETKTEAKEAKVEIKHELMEALGEDYPDLAKKLTPAIDKYIARKLEEGTEEIKNTLKGSEQAKLEERSEATFKKISDEFYEGKDVPAEVDTEMARLMKKYLPEQGQDIEEYVTDIFHLATSKVGKTPQSKAVKAAATASRTNAPSKLDTSKGRPIPSTENLSPRAQGKKLSLNESVALAIKEINDSMGNN